VQPYLADADLTVYCGDALTVLRELPDESAQMCVTSPPYWGLRDYGTGAWEGGDANCDHLAPLGGGTEATGLQQYRDICGKCGATRVDNQIGLEPTPEAFVATMVEVFREVRRVLRKDGTLWLNLGDSYNAAGRDGHGTRIGYKQQTNRASASGADSNRPTAPGLKPKDLCMIPARVALALQADGWYLRSEITWCKPNPMPESVTDRPTQATEKVYLFSKASRYFYDAEAVREPYQLSTIDRDRYGYNHAFANQFKGSPTDERHPDGKQLPPGSFAAGPDGRKKTKVQAGDGSAQHRDGERWPNPAGRNLRNWWEIATEPYPEAHFATYPTELVRRCIAAGTSERGCCPECGAPWMREIAVERGDQEAQRRPKHLQSDKSGLSLSGSGSGEWAKRGSQIRQLGWRPTCECFGHVERYLDDEGDECSRYVWEREVPTTIAGVVLDPFLGSGTTAAVARNHGRRCIGIELSEDYCKLIEKRTQQLSLLSGEAA
jgi:DNA modification methylase